MATRPKAGGLMPAHNPPPTIAPNFGTQAVSVSLDSPKEQTFKIIGNDLIARVEYGQTMGGGNVGTGLT